VGFAGGGAQGGYGIANAVLRKGNNVHIAFDHNNAIEAAF